MRLARTASAAALALLGAVALAGLAATAAWLLVATPAGSAFLVPRALSFVDERIEGSIELDRFLLTSRGALELHGLRVRDPAGEVVIEAERAFGSVNLGLLRHRVAALELELDAPRVAIVELPEGTLSIARAFRSTRPSPEEEEPRGESAWKVRLDRLALRGGAVTWRDAGGALRLDAGGVDADARGAWSSAASEVELAVRAALRAPVEGAVDVATAASLSRGRIAVPRLRAAVGRTSLEAAGEWDLAARSGRAAIGALAVDAAALKRLVPAAPLAGDVAGRGYAEADGARATAALDLRPAGGGGELRLAAAVLMEAPLRAGFDLESEGVDPARLVEGAPGGSVTLAGQGWLAGTDPDSLAGAARLALRPSTLRGGRILPGTVVAAVDGGRVTVSTLDVGVPGARVRGAGALDRGGAIEGTVRLDANDLRVAAREVEALAGLALPDVRGRARLEAEVSGSTDAPRARFSLDGPALALGATAAEGLALQGDLAGPLDAPAARVDGRARRLVAGGLVAEEVALSARASGRALEARVGARLPAAGGAPLSLDAAGALAPDRKALALERLELAWPEERFALTAPARVQFDPPRVDRLELANGPQRVAVEGGLTSARDRRRRPRPALDARATVAELDLASLPPGLLPPGLGLAGRVSLDATASGPTAAPEVEVRARVADAAFRGLSGLGAEGELAWRGSTRRLEADVSARRAAGGAATVSLDLPAALLRARRDEPIRLQLRAQGLPLDELARLAGSAAAVAGTGDLSLDVSGTPAALGATADLSLDEVRSGAYGPFELRGRLEAPGRVARLQAGLDWEGVRAVEATASAPVDLAAFLRAPAAEAKRLPETPLTADVTILPLELAKLAPLLGLPPELRGTVQGGAELKGGTLRAPRGSVGLEAVDVAGWGYRDVELTVAGVLSDGLTAAAGSGSVAGSEILQYSASIQASPEDLAAEGVVQRTPLALDVLFLDATLAGTGDVPISANLGGRVHAEGTLARPVLAADVRGRGVAVKGHPLGDLTILANARDRSLYAGARLDVTAGGTLTADVRARGAPLSLVGLDAEELLRAPATASLVADRVDLGFLPAALPGTVRSAGGLLGADIRAEGPLGKLRPVGTLKVSDGRLAVSEMGEWTEIEIVAALTQDTLDVEKLTARRGDGRLDGRLRAEGLARMEETPARITGHLATADLTIPRAGQDLATVDAEADVTGTLAPERLEAEVTIPRATVWLPERTPRGLFPLEQRDDIVIGPEREEGARRLGGPRPYRTTVKVLVPNRFFVRSNNPRAQVELRADTTVDVVGARAYAEGTVDVVRGEVEPIGGRTFQIERGKVTFTGGAPTDAALDIVARYDNPAAKVTVTVSGTTEKPIVKMTSDPAMDEAQIAMLIATGRTEIKAGGGAVGTLTGEEAGKAALGAVATQAFKDIVADKLPLDSVALDSSQIRAGKYVTDKIYVGYTRSFEAKLEQGENQNEVRVEYQMTPRWTFESRYGDARTGGASLIWSKDY